MVETEGAGPARDRIELLDALRGFALFGILLVNIRDWAGWYVPKQQQIALAGESAARWYDFVVTAVLEGKFYTLFSLLFGLGFALQLSRLEARGRDGIAIFRRRLLVLLAIGLVHMVLMWEGDILVLYACLGLLLPLVRNWSDRRLLSFAVLLILLPIPGYAIVHQLGIDPDLRLKELGDGLFTALGGDNGQAPVWRARSDLGSLVAWNLSGPPFRIGGFFESWRIPKVLAIMLLGFWAGRRLVDGRLLADRARLRRIAMIGFAIGVPLNLAYAWLGGLEQEQFDKGLAATALYAFGVVPLALGYGAVFALMSPYARALVALFAAPGRMALTNYLSQTVAGIAIFYGVGFGLFAKLPPLQICAVAAAIFSVQIVWSHLWLRSHAQGPMEALWRRLTYGRRAVTGSPASV
ncbi:MAG: DUF418 domain-containing protein [Sphingomonas sp.]|nr:DUF418 domain-containing protein [Sphingomonas sp.]